MLELFLNAKSLPEFCCMVILCFKFIFVLLLKLLIHSNINYHDFSI